MLRHRLTVSLAGLLLLIAQLGVTVHAAEHLFHDEVASCEVFIVAEKHSAPDIVVSIHEPADGGSSVPLWYVSELAGTDKPQFFLARAPPSIDS